MAILFRLATAACAGPASYPARMQSNRQGMLSGSQSSHSRSEWQPWPPVSMSVLPHSALALTCGRLPRSSGFWFWLPSLRRAVPESGPEKVASRLAGRHYPTSEIRRLFRRPLGGTEAKKTCRQRRAASDHQPLKENDSATEGRLMCLVACQLAVAVLELPVAHHGVDGGTLEGSVPEDIHDV